MVIHQVMSYCSYKHHIIKRITENSATSGRTAHPMAKARGLRSHFGQVRLQQAHDEHLEDIEKLNDDQK